jgi:hypothetical protein
MKNSSVKELMHAIETVLAGGTVAAVTKRDTQNVA